LNSLCRRDAERGSLGPEGAFKNGVFGHARELAFTNVDFNVSLPTLLAFFEKFGGVESCQLHPFRDNGKIRVTPGRPVPKHSGGGFVIFKSSETTFKLLERCPKEGRTWRVSAMDIASRPRNPKPGDKWPGTLKVCLPILSNQNTRPLLCHLLCLYMVIYHALLS
jgi:hypothetical protein